MSSTTAALRPIAWLTALTTVGSAVYCRSIGWPWSPILTVPHFLPAFVTASIMAVSALAVRYPRGIPDLSHRVSYTLAAGALIVLTQGAFHSVKVSIGASGFHAEDTLLAFDRALHGPDLSGRLATAIGPSALYVIDWLYTLGWSAMAFCFTLWMCWARQTRALFAWLLLWVVGGMIVAIMCASAGPIFTTYAPMSGTISASASAWLWSVHEARATTAFAGISAFPSLHVGGAALVALAMPSRAWRLASSVATTFTLFASVALGWHYMIDGYAGILLALVTWRVAARLTSPKSDGWPDPGVTRLPGSPR